MVPYTWQRCVCSGAFACSFSHPQLPPASNASNIVDFIDQQSFYTKISQWRSESWKSYQGIYNRTRQERSKHPCQLIHTNLVGSISPTCFLGERLFFTFVAWKICLVIKVHSEYCHKMCYLEMHRIYSVLLLLDSKTHVNQLSYSCQIRCVHHHRSQQPSRTMAFGIQRPTLGPRRATGCIVSRPSTI